MRKWLLHSLGDSRATSAKCIGQKSWKCEVLKVQWKSLLHPVPGSWDFLSLCIIRRRPTSFNRKWTRLPTFHSEISRSRPPKIAPQNNKAAFGAQSSRAFFDDKDASHPRLIRSRRLVQHPASVSDTFKLIYEHKSARTSRQFFASSIIFSPTFFHFSGHIRTKLSAFSKVNFIDSSCR